MVFGKSDAEKEAEFQQRFDDLVDETAGSGRSQTTVTIPSEFNSDDIDNFIEAMHKRGYEAQSISPITGYPSGTIRGYLALFRRMTYREGTT